MTVPPAPSCPHPPSASAAPEEESTVILVQGVAVPVVFAYDTSGLLTSAAVASPEEWSSGVIPWDQAVRALCATALVLRPHSLTTGEYSVSSYVDPAGGAGGWIVYRPWKNHGSPSHLMRAEDCVWMIYANSATVRSTLVVLGQDGLPDRVFVRTFDPFGGETTPGVAAA